MVRTTMTTELVRIDEREMTRSLGTLAKALDSNAGEVSVDFSAVRRVGADDLRSMERLARTAEDKKVRIVLHGVNVEVYKALKLARVAKLFTFES